MKYPVLTFMTFGLGAAAVWMSREGSVKDSEAKNVRKQLMPLQRVSRLSRDYCAWFTLINAGLDSAMSIVNKPKDVFR